MDDFPKDLLEEIDDLALAIVNAGAVGDVAVAESVFYGCGSFTKQE